MFFLVEQFKELEVHPRFFGPKLREEIERRLRQEVEGTCNGEFGFILAVISVLDTGKGLIREGSGSAVFNLRYKCICMKPFKGQVMDVVVTSVNKVSATPSVKRRAALPGGAQARGAPPTSRALPPTTVPPQMGFFSEAGPLQVFVSNHLIPEAFEFNTTHEPCYQTADGDQKIVPGSEVRLRIVGTRVDASDIVSRTHGATARRCVTRGRKRCALRCLAPLAEQLAVDCLSR